MKITNCVLKYNSTMLCKKGAIVYMINENSTSRSLGYQTKGPFGPIIMFVWGFMPSQQYFSYLTATVHKSMFPEIFLAST